MVSSKVKKRSPLYVGAKSVNVRVPPADLAQFTAWIDRQPDPKPTLPEALRRLARKALACEPPQIDDAKGFE
jgi:hypothetical protein